MLLLIDAQYYIHTYHIPVLVAMSVAVVCVCVIFILWLGVFIIATRHVSIHRAALRSAAEGMAFLAMLHAHHYPPLLYCIRQCLEV